MYNLNGQVAIITGAGSGIGRAIAMRLSLEGAAIVAADLNENTAEKLIQEIKGWEGAGSLWKSMYPAKETLKEWSMRAGEFWPDRHPGQQRRNRKC